jgi:hypothetical protein
MARRKIMEWGIGGFGGHSMERKEAGPAGQVCENIERK